jgi:lipoprotein-anchoring transpeptidase ErfK/SrfK
MDMKARTKGWAGLVIAAAGLLLVGATHFLGARPDARAASTVMAPIVLDAAPVGAASNGAPSPGAPPSSGTPVMASATSAPAATPAAQVAAADQTFVIKRILPITGPIRYGDWHWDEAGVPPGPLVITVDLQARVLSVFRGGYEIAATAVLLGTSDKPTPTGLFPITQKDADHVSNIYDGAPMPFMLRLTDDGITIHATKVQNGYASHGCVGVPLPFAQKLFGIAQLGTPVYITRGKMVGVGANLKG